MIDRTEQIVNLYTTEHLTCAEIGAQFGISRQRVYQILTDAGVQREDGTWIELTCERCGSPFRQLRCRYRAHARHFCSARCYHATRANRQYKANRQGQRTARWIVSAYFDLLPSHVVHHINSNQSDNRISNLMVFASHSDHLKYHHSITSITPLFDGRTVIK